MAEYKKVEIPPESTPQSTDILHQAVQLHISTCGQCQHAINSSKPKAIGERTGMCKAYLDLVQFFANGAEL